MPFRVDVSADCPSLPCHFVKEDKDNTEDVILDNKLHNVRIKDKDRVTKKIFPNDVLQIQNGSVHDSEIIVEDVIDHDPPIEISRWSSQPFNSQILSKQTEITSYDELIEITVVGEVRLTKGRVLEPRLSAKVYKKGRSTRREPYLDLLVAKEMAMMGKSVGGKNVHEGGFATVYKLMAGEPVECPLCLEVSFCLPHLCVASAPVLILFSNFLTLFLFFLFCFFLFLFYRIRSDPLSLSVCTCTAISALWMSSTESATKVPSVLYVADRLLWNH